MKLKLSERSCTIDALGKHEVKGANVVPANGVYNEDEMVNGRPSYFKHTRDFYIQWDGTRWIIGQSDGSEYYQNISDSFTPPKNGWLGGNGSNPVPTVHPITSYFVSGAGDKEANGTYIEDGMHNGKPYYVYNGCWILSYATAGKWQIRHDLEDLHPNKRHYKVSSSADTPPKTGWKPNDKVSAPAPTVMVCPP